MHTHTYFSKEGWGERALSCTDCWWDCVLNWVFHFNAPLPPLHTVKGKAETGVDENRRVEQRSIKEKPLAVVWKPAACAWEELIRWWLTLGTRQHSKLQLFQSSLSSAFTPCSSPVSSSTASTLCMAEFSVFIAALENVSQSPGLPYWIDPSSACHSNPNPTFLRVSALALGPAQFRVSICPFWKPTSCFPPGEIACFL